MLALLMARGTVLSSCSLVGALCWVGWLVLVKRLDRYEPLAWMLLQELPHIQQPSFGSWLKRLADI